MAVPPPPPLPRWRKTTTIAVLIGPPNGDKPATTDRVDYLRPLNASVGFGGQQLDSVSLAFDLDRFGSRLEDTTLPSGHNRTVELRVENPVTGELDRLLAWGKLARQPQRIGNREAVEFIGRLDHFLFGDRLSGFPVKHPTFGVVDVRKPWVFNPLIDDTRLPNRSDLTDTHGARLFLDPESLRTGPAKTLQAAAASRWDLATAVERLCWSLNPSETWIKNPTLAALQVVLGVGTSLLENHTIALDTTLPEALDALLAPHGYTWFVEHTIDTSDPALPATSTIAIAERGAGLPITLRLQRLGDLIDSSETNIDTLNVSYDIAARPNVIEGYSSLALREGTFELWPAWEKTDDGLTLADLKDDEKREEHPDVFRRWVLNEAGDYDGLRDEFAGGHADFEPLFGVPTVPRRRRFRPCLTQGRDRKPIGRNGYRLEWQDGVKWQECEAHFSVLEHECGIRLDHPPEELVDRFVIAARGSPPPAVLRLTAVIEGDDLTLYRAERRAESANGVDIPRRYDLSHKFHDARVADSGTFASVLYADRHEAIVAATVGASTSSVTVAADLTVAPNDLKEGDRIAILDSTDNDGVYHVASATLSGTDTVILLREPLVSTTADGVIGYLTDEERCDTQLQAYCEEIQANEDFVVIHADATLFGVDQPEYTLGKIVTKVEQRNLSLDSYAAAAVAQRHPQITRINYQFDGRQTIGLTLDQFDRVTDRGFQRLLKK